MPVTLNDEGAGGSTETETDADRSDDRSNVTDHRGSGSDRFRDRSLLVVGAGPMGRWIADVLDAGDTTFCDTDRATATRATERVGGRVVETDSTERFDLVGIAVPISAADEAITAHAHKARECLFDVTGTMRGPVTAMATHALDAERVSFHPLFAPEHAPGRVAMTTGREIEGEEMNSGNDRDPGSIVTGIADALRAAGNEPFCTTPTEHDRAMETVQARAHAAVLAYSLAAESVDERFHTPVSAALSEVASRVTGGSARTYAEIQAAFEGSDEVATVARRIADAGDDDFRRLYREARSKSDARSNGETRSEGDTKSNGAAGVGGEGK